jgi:hypothetical protein
MQSAAGLVGALVMLLGAVLALAIGAVGGDAELVFHVVLSASFALLARSAFDFTGPGWIKIVGCSAMGLLAAIFLLQAVNDLAPSEQLRHIALDLLGQRVERILGYVFIGWCLSVVLAHSKGVTRLLGGVILTVVIGVEIYGLVVIWRGGQMPGALRLLSLLLFVPLLLESAKAQPPRDDRS